MHLTPRDEDILVTLTAKGRVVDAGLLARTWWSFTPSGRNEARRRTRRMVRAGLLRELIVIARPLPPLREPVYGWEPGAPRPNLARATRLLQERLSAPPRPTFVYLATAKAAALTGGKAPGLKHPLQCTHDLGVMKTFLEGYREKSPELARAWVSEDCLPKPTRRHVRRPDAVILAPSGEVALAIEFGGAGGAYGRERLEATHAHFERLSIPYLLW